MVRESMEVSPNNYKTFEPTGCPKKINILKAIFYIKKKFTL